MAGEVDQVAAVDEGNDLHPGGQDVVVHLLDLFVEGLESRIRRRSLAQQDDPGDDVVVIDDLAVFAVDGSGELSEADFWTLRDYGDIPHAQGRAVSSENNRLLDIANPVDQTDFANVDLLQSGLDETSACVGVVVGQLLLNLRQT